jgi:hypothetical protein
MMAISLRGTRLPLTSNQKTAATSSRPAKAAFSSSQPANGSSSISASRPRTKFSGLLTGR